MKVYWKDFRLKVVDAIDRGMARQGVAYTREALEEAIPHPGCALSSVKLEDVAGWFSRCGYEPQDQYSSRPLSDPACGGTGDAAFTDFRHHRPLITGDLLIPLR